MTLDGATLSLTLGGGYAPAFGDRLFLITNDGRTRSAASSPACRTGDR